MICGGELVAGSGVFSPARAAYPAGDPSWFHLILFILVLVFGRSSSLVG
jgi:hypothetical protein